MEEGLAEFRSDMQVVWLYYSAEASDPEGTKCGMSGLRHLLNSLLRS